ncbi:MAG: glycosyltransferase, partial [Candidatus Cryptobacteroides sp.]
MKIAILSCFYPYRGGISQFNACLFKELGKRHDVKAFNFTRQYPELLFPGKTQYVTGEDTAEKIPSEAVLDTANPISFIRTARRIDEWGPDVLIVRYWMSWFAPSLGYVCRRLRKKCRVVGILDNVVPHEPRFFDTPFTKYFLSGMDGCVTLCRSVADDLLRLRKDKPYAVIQHPLYSHFGEKIDRMEACRRLGIPDDKHNILFFGLIREYKGLDILLESFKSLGPEYHLIIAGEPYGSFERYRSIMDGIPDAATRITEKLDYIPDSEVPLWFSAADVTVLPYRSATQSGISAVSYHFEVPMIVTEVGGLKETIGDSGTGIVTEECTPRAIAEAIGGY